MSEISTVILTLLHSSFAITSPGIRTLKFGIHPKYLPSGHLMISGGVISEIQVIFCSHKALLLQQSIAPYCRKRSCLQPVFDTMISCNQNTVSRQQSSSTSSFSGSGAGIATGLQPKLISPGHRILGGFLSTIQLKI